ncbi:MAG TPA: alcohol dehydrogenase, partial [Nitrospirae bacterium]|nr:alcohol dehydrogenase [Nitrospirota bacterium]
GSGISGLLHIHLSKLKGARVIATDINDYRLKKAAEFGADYVINAASYSPDELTRINNGHPAEKVIVCTGAARAVQDAFLSVDRRGTLLFFAVPGKDITIPSVRFWREEVSLSFSYGAAPVDLREAVELISSKEVETGRMITHTVALTDIRKGFDLVSEAGDSLKIVVIPD